MIDSFTCKTWQPVVCFHFTASILKHTHTHIHSVSQPALSGPETDDEDCYRQTDDEVDINDESKSWLLLQGIDGVFRCRRHHGIIVSRPLFLHPTQPAEGGHHPGLAGDAGHWGWGVWQEREDVISGQTDAQMEEPRGRETHLSCDDMPFHCWPRALLPARSSGQWPPLRSWCLAARWKPAVWVPQGQAL